jgi:signal transduction histidine kinase/ActR/RegA family two-component response regulator
MTMPELNEPVAVLAPTGRDAVLISDALSRSRVRAEVCSDLEQFARRLQNDAAAGLFAQEALRTGDVSTVGRVLREQPAWSDVPLILMTNHRAPDPSVLRLLDDGVNITLLERPVRIQTLTSAVDSALRQRRRQYELRDQLAEQRRTEERLRQTQKLESLGILAGGIAHDFNNLLTGIIGNVSLALDCEPPESPLRRYLEDAIHASERAADLTRQLLAYSGKGKFSIQSLDLSDVVRQINALIQTSISKNVQVLLHLEKGLPIIEADSAQLQQIVMNLIINAAEAISPDQDGVVIIETGIARVDDAYLKGTMAAEGAEPGEYVYLEVRDTGSGIDEATLTRIFDPFFTTKFMGRGLGLAAVMGIVRGHHGALKVQTAPGKGSTFRVLFPAIERAQARASACNRHHDLAGTGTILVVDDEAIVRQIAKNSLESWGYRVLLATNGQMALDLFGQAQDEITMVLLDLTMPVMNGEQTFQRLRQIRPGIPVLLTSGYDEADATSRFTGSCLAGFLQKPYTAATLAGAVKRVLETAKRVSN